METKERHSVYYFLDDGRIKIHLNRILTLKEEDVEFYRKLMTAFDTHEQVYFNSHGTFWSGIPSKNAETVFYKNNIMLCVQGTNNMSQTHRTLIGNSPSLGKCSAWFAKMNRTIVVIQSSDCTEYEV